MITNWDFILYLYLLLSSLYFLLLSAINRGLNRFVISDGNQDYSISIIIAARNEEKRIIPCLASLERLDFPQDKYEIIFVDDHSVDKTASVISAYCNNHRNWKLISLDNIGNRLKGKKNALQTGISQAKGELIFTTDADCIVPPKWLKNMSGYFSSDISMVLGYSPLVNSNKWYFRLLQFDNLFSTIVSAATAKLGYPFTSVGRNMAYRKDAYEHVGDFFSLKKFRSGDDVHLTGQFRSYIDGRIDFCAEEDTFVKTHIPSTDLEVVQQQIRKNSKTLQLSGWSILGMLMILLYYLVLILFPFTVPSLLTLWLFLLSLKFLMEFILLKKAAKIFKQSDLIPYLPLMQLLYPPYIIIFSAIGLFQFYQWKN